MKVEIESEEPAFNAATRPEHTLKRCSTPEDLRRSQLPFIADGKLVAPPRTSPRQDLSSVLRRHACPEPVGVLPFALVWLKRPLHDSSSGKPTGCAGEHPKKKGVVRPRTILRVTRKGTRCSNSNLRNSSLTFNPLPTKKRLRSACAPHLSTLYFRVRSPWGSVLITCGLPVDPPRQATAPRLLYTGMLTS